MERYSSDPSKPSTAVFGILYSLLAPCITVNVSPDSEMTFPISIRSLERTFLCITRSQRCIIGSDIVCQNYNTKNSYLKLINRFRTIIIFSHKRLEMSTKFVFSVIDDKCVIRQLLGWGEAFALALQARPSS